VITGISIISVWVLDQDRAKRFYCDQLGFEVTNDLELENGMRWLTVRPAGSRGQEFLLMNPSHSMLDQETALQVRALVAKGGPEPGRDEHHRLPSRPCRPRCQRSPVQPASDRSTLRRRGGIAG